MRAHALTLAMLLLILSSSACDTRNVGSGLLVPVPNVPSSRGLVVPEGAAAGDTVTFAVLWERGEEPWQVSFDFGGGAEPVGDLRQISAKSASTSFAERRCEQDALLTVDAGGQFVVSATVTDNNGASLSQSKSYEYAKRPNRAPVISVSSDIWTNIMTVHGEDADGDDITVYASASEDIIIESSKVILGGDGDTTFHAEVEAVLSEEDLEIRFTCEDSHGLGGNEAEAYASNPPVYVGADTLYAIPVDFKVSTGEPVTVVVVTGVPASPFQYMNGCRVTCSEPMRYVPLSFNVGYPGGPAGGIDGFWTGMNPSGGFLLPPDSFFDPGGPSLHLDFNVTPLHGSDRTTDEGPLFTFDVTFDSPGEKVFGFEQTSIVDRTFYTDGNQTANRYWGDISNNHAGIPNSVIVE